MPGFTSTPAPEPKLMATPPPAPINKDLNTKFMEWLSTTGPGFMDTLRKVSSGAGLTDVSDLFKKNIAASDRSEKEGEANIKESMGASGMRFSGDLMKNLVDFHSQISKDRSAQLSNLLLNARGQQLGAAEFGAGMFSGAAQAMTPTATLVSPGTPSPGWGNTLMSGMMGGAEIGLMAAGL